MLRNEKTQNGTGKDRQKRYRMRLLEKDALRNQKIFAHHSYRVQLNIMLARLRQPADWLATHSGVDSITIESGNIENCGLFTPRQIAALYQALPQVAPPHRQLW